MVPAPEIHSAAIGSMAYFFLRKIHCEDYPEEFETEMDMFVHALEHDEANIEHRELFYTSLSQELAQGSYLNYPYVFERKATKELIRIDVHGSFPTKGEFTKRVYQIVLDAIEGRQEDEPS